MRSGNVVNIREGMARVPIPRARRMEMIAALVAGDSVNGKFEIIEMIVGTMGDVDMVMFAEATLDVLGNERGIRPRTYQRVSEGRWG
jgi:hypothetical protein